MQDVYYASSAGKDAPFSANRRITDRTNNRALGYTNGLGTFPPVNTPVDGGVLVAWGDTREANFDTNNQDIYLAKVDPHTSANLPVTKLAASKLSVSASQLAYPGGADYVGTKTVTKVVMVNDHDGPEALAAAVLARANYGPLLASPAKALPKPVADEITRLKPVGAYVIGDETQLSAGVVSAVGTAVGKGTPERLAGRDPADTARLIAQAMDTRSDADKAESKPAFPAVLILNPADKAASAAAAVAASVKLPILFADFASIPAATTEAISSLAITKTLVVGTTAVISDAVLAKLPSAERASAADLGAKVSGLGGTQPHLAPTNVVYVASSDRPVDVAVMAAAVSRLDGTLLGVPGGSSAAAAKTLGHGQISAVDREVVVATPASTAVPWPVIIVGGLLALVGIGLFVVARRRSP